MPGDLELPFGIKMTNPTPLSILEGPYPSLAAACAAITGALRFPTMSVRVVPTDGSDPYTAQWGLDLSDGGLAKASTGGGLASVIDATYAELTALVGSLIPGQIYRLTDYATTWVQQQENGAKQTLRTSSAEPLYLQALDASTLSQEARSQLYPGDSVLYDINGGGQGDIISEGTIRQGTPEIPGHGPLIRMITDCTNMSGYYDLIQGDPLPAHEFWYGIVYGGTTPYTYGQTSGSYGFSGRPGVNFQVVQNDIVPKGWTAQTPNFVFGSAFNNGDIKIKLDGVNYPLNINHPNGTINNPAFVAALAALDPNVGHLFQFWDNVEPDAYSVPDDLDFSVAAVPAVPSVPAQDLQLPGRITWRKDQRGNEAPFDFRGMLVNGIISQGSPAAPGVMQIAMNVPYQLDALIETVPDTPPQYFFKLDTTALTQNYVDVGDTNHDNGGIFLGSEQSAYAVFDQGPITNQNSGTDQELPMNFGPLDDVHAIGYEGGGLFTSVKLKINGVNYVFNQQVSGLVLASDGATPIDWTAINGNGQYPTGNVLVQLWDTVEPAQYDLTPGTPLIQGVDGNSDQIISWNVYSGNDPNNPWSSQAFQQQFIPFGTSQSLPITETLSTNAENTQLSVSIVSSKDYARPFNVMVNGTVTRIASMQAGVPVQLATDAFPNLVLSMYGDSAEGFTGAKLDMSQVLGTYAGQGNDSDAGNSWELLLYKQVGAQPDNTVDLNVFGTESTGATIDRVYPMLYLDPVFTYYAVFGRKLTGGASISININGQTTTYSDINITEVGQSFGTGTWPEGAVIWSGTGNIALAMWDDQGIEQSLPTVPDMVSGGITTIPDADMEYNQLPDWSAEVPAQPNTYGDLPVFADDQGTVGNYIEQWESQTVTIGAGSASNRVLNGQNFVYIGPEANRNMIAASNVDLSAGFGDDNWISGSSNNIRVGGGFFRNRIVGCSQMTYGQNCTDNIEFNFDNILRPDNYSNNTPYSFSAHADTWGNLNSLAQNSQLVPGKPYIVTDYQTQYRQPATNTQKTAAEPEPLMIVASSVNTFETDAWSALYPKDIIRYEFFAQQNSVISEISGPQGAITYRMDDRYNEAPFDHRNVMAPGILTPEIEQTPGTAQLSFMEDLSGANSVNWNQFYKLALFDQSNNLVLEWDVQSKLNSGSETLTVPTGEFTLKFQGALTTGQGAALQVSTLNQGSQNTQQIALDSYSGQGGVQVSRDFAPYSLPNLGAESGPNTWMFPGTVTVTCGGHSSTDDGNGLLVGDLQGTVNYLTSGTLVNITNTNALGIEQDAVSLTYMTWDPTWQQASQLASGLQGNVTVQPYGNVPALDNFSVKYNFTANGGDFGINILDASGKNVFDTSFQGISQDGQDHIVGSYLGPIVQNGPYSLQASGISSAGYDIYVNGTKYEAPPGYFFNTPIAEGLAASFQVVLCDTGATPSSADALASTAARPAAPSAYVPPTDNTAGTQFQSATYQDLPTFGANSYGNVIRFFTQSVSMNLNGSAIRGNHNVDEGMLNFIGFSWDGSGAYQESEGGATYCAMGRNSQNNFIGEESTGCTVAPDAQKNVIMSGGTNVKIGLFSEQNYVGQNTQNIEIKSTSNSNWVGQNSNNIYIGNQSNSNHAPENSSEWYILDRCQNNRAYDDGQSYNNIYISDQSENNVFSEGSGGMRIGFNSSNNRFKTGSTGNTLQDYVTGCLFEQNSQYNLVMTDSSNCRFSNGSETNTVWQQCENIVFAYQASNNMVYPDTENCTLYGSSSTIWQQCGSIVFDQGCTDMVVGESSYNVTFVNSSRCNVGRYCNGSVIQNMQNCVFGEQLSNFHGKSGNGCVFGSNVYNFTGGWGMDQISVSDNNYGLTIGDSHNANSYKNTNNCTLGDSHSDNSYEQLYSVTLGNNWNSNQIAFCGSASYGSGYSDNSIKYVFNNEGSVTRDNWNSNELWNSSGDFGNDFSENKLWGCSWMVFGDNATGNELWNCEWVTFGIQASQNKLWNSRYLGFGANCSQNEMWNCGGAYVGGGTLTFGNSCVGNYLRNANLQGGVYYGDGTSWLTPWPRGLEQITTSRGDYNSVSRPLQLGTMNGVTVLATKQADLSSINQAQCIGFWGSYVFYGDPQNNRIAYMSKDQTLQGALPLTTFFGTPGTFGQLTDTALLYGSAVFCFDGDAMYIADSGNNLQGGGRILRIASVSAAITALNAGTAVTAEIAADYVASGLQAPSGLEYGLRATTVSVFNDTLYLSDINDVSAILAIAGISSATLASNPQAFVAAGYDANYAAIIDPANTFGVSLLGSFCVDETGLYAWSVAGDTSSVTSQVQLWNFATTGWSWSSVYVDPAPPFNQDWYSTQLYNGNTLNTSLNVNDEAPVMFLIGPYQMQKVGSRLYSMGNQLITYLDLDGDRKNYVAVQTMNNAAGQASFENIYGSIEELYCFAVDDTRVWFFTVNGQEGNGPFGYVVSFDLSQLTSLKRDSFGSLSINNRQVLKDGDIVARERLTAYSGGTAMRDFSVANTIRPGSDTLFYDGALLDPEDPSQGYDYDPSTGKLTTNFDVDLGAHRLQLSYQIGSYAPLLPAWPPTNPMVDDSGKKFTFTAGGNA